jgi:broad specificity phosphatase PhoE
MAVIRRFASRPDMWLYCVRHGESVYNAEGRIQGQSDVPLSEFGRRQSEAIADRLADLPIDAIYSSPLKRAWETAEAIARRVGLPIRGDDRLKELNVGLFQDHLRRELPHLFPEALARWKSGDPDFVLPGGESRNELKRRGRAAFLEIGSRGHEHAVLVAHGRLLAVTLAGLVDLPGDDGAPSLENGSITTLRVREGATFELVAFNEVDHLQHVGLTGSGDL